MDRLGVAAEGKKKIGLLFKEKNLYRDHNAARMILTQAFFLCLLALTNSWLSTPMTSNFKWTKDNRRTSSRPGAIPEWCWAPMCLNKRKKRWLKWGYIYCDDHCAEFGEITEEDVPEFPTASSAQPNITRPLFTGFPLSPPLYPLSPYS